MLSRWMPTCLDITELASDYLDGNLSALQRFWFKVHLWRCEACAEFVRQIQLVRDGLPNLGADAEQLPPEVRNSLLDEFRRTHGGEPPR